eukprot:4054278-Pleurochrysis_carterae.AAC.4
MAVCTRLRALPERSRASCCARAGHLRGVLLALDRALGERRRQRHAHRLDARRGDAALARPARRRRGCRRQRGRADAAVRRPPRPQRRQGRRAHARSAGARDFGAQCSVGGMRARQALKRVYQHGIHRLRAISVSALNSPYVSALSTACPCAHAAAAATPA